MDSLVSSLSLPNQALGLNYQEKLTPVIGPKHFDRSLKLRAPREYKLQKTRENKCTEFGTQRGVV